MVWKELQQQYTDYQMRLLTIEKLVKQKQAIQKQMRRAQREIEGYEAQLIDARKQLNKLDQFSFIQLFQKWTGKYDEILEEQFGVVATKELKLIESQLMYEDLQHDLNALSDKLQAADKQAILRQVEKVMKQKELWLMQHAPKQAAKLNDLLEQELHIKQLKKEIVEAQEAGKEARRALMDAVENLVKAKNYSTWDTFLGGGLIATAMKHEKLNYSEAYIHKAQMALQRFHNELLDVQNMQHKAFTVEVDGFVKFADYFFDDIFSAWSVHSKIATAIEQLSRVQDDVANTQLMLENKLEYLLEKEKNIAQQREIIFSTEDESLFF
ncbi:hypothetical protein P9B03_06860 [Metasolibacillus meyeri]|uniref:Uncharacterized protein n=1 Tax=Metasolibacillus meyeri TaxID=1071052 RepID=A0AAW9NR43_9BACL|nr:hypothetical protein [Metasolibacillus meyeri]MEC1178199.1 hypothetical protein [Metasolibacillus meyeri]